MSPPPTWCRSSRTAAAGSRPCRFWAGWRLLRRRVAHCRLGGVTSVIPRRLRPPVRLRSPIFTRMVPKRAAVAEEPSLFPHARGRSRSRARMRPRTLDEFVGQVHLLGPGKPLRVLIERGRAGLTDPLGPARAREDHARPPGRPGHRPDLRSLQRSQRRRAPHPGDLQPGRGSLGPPAPETVLFVDEIHRLNKAQQDSLLPPAEDGTITLIGATTENPSFEVIGALLSRTRVFVLEPLAAADLRCCSARAGGSGAGAGRPRASRWTRTRSRSSRTRLTATRAAR